MAQRTAGGAQTLPARYYLADDIWQRELTQLFYQRWLCVGRADSLLSASYLLYETGDENVIVLRDEQGGLRAFFNVCRHRGTRLCSEPAGRLARTLQCPYHAWTYALDGRLVGAPHMDEVAGFDRAQHGLVPVTVAEWAGFVFINLAANPLPFADAFAPVLGRFGRWQLDQLRTAHSVTYDVAANWKLIFQNYSECYHCPTLHPVLNTLTPYKGADNDLQDGMILGGPMVLSAESLTLTGRACGSPLNPQRMAYYYTFSPTFFLSLMPDYVLTHRLEPLGPGRTRIVCDWLFHPDALARADFDPTPAIAFWDMTNRQDWHVSELTQLGVRSRAYQPAPYAELESVLAAFDRDYLAALAA